MARRITAFLISIVLVFSLAVISFADQTPEIYDFTDQLILQTVYNDGTATENSNISDIVFDRSATNVARYNIFVNNSGSYVDDPDASYTLLVSGFVNSGLENLNIPFAVSSSSGSTKYFLVVPSYDPTSGYFSASVNVSGITSLPYVRFTSTYLSDNPELTFCSLRSFVVTIASDESSVSSYDPIQALTANSENNGTVTLSALSNFSEQRFNPIFSEPLQKGVTYLVSLGVTQTGASSEDITQPIQLSGLWNGTISSLGAAIPYTHHMTEASMYYLSQFYSGSATGTESGNFSGSGSLNGSVTDYGVLSGIVGSQGTYVGTGQHTESGLITGSTVGFMPVTQTATFLYTPTADSSNPFTFEIGCSGSNYEWSANVTVQALPVVGVQLDDVQENQSFAAWLNNKLDSIFGGIAARLDGIFSKQDNAYEDAADDAVDEGLGQVEQEHAREEELTQEAISNLDEALNAVELPDLTQQQEINSGIGLLNTVIFDGFFGNPQMRFLLIFSLGMALAAVVLRLNH